MSLSLFRATGHLLTAPEAFAILSMFAGLQFTIGTLAHVVRCISETNVAFRRLQEFLDLPEYSNPVAESALSGGSDLDLETLVLDLTGINMAWNKAAKIGKGG